MPHTPALSSRVSRRRFLAGTGAAIGAATLGRAPAVIGQSVRELQHWLGAPLAELVHSWPEAQLASLAQARPVGE